VLAVCLAVLAVAGVGAQPEPDPTADLLQLRIGEMRDGTPVEIAGERLASTVVLPDFYEGRGFQPAWIDPGARTDLLSALRESRDDGLDPRDYHLVAIDSLARLGPGPERDADLDLLATDGVIRLAYHLRFGKVDAATVEPDWEFTPAAEAAMSAPPAAALERAVAGRRVSAGLDSLRPRHWLYGALRGALQQYRQIESLGGWPRLPNGPVLRPGASDPRLPALEKRLAVEGDLVTPPRATVTAYDSVLVAAMARFQQRHGLNPDGVIGPGSLSALNVPVATRIAQLRVALERGRLLLQELPERFVLVNIPAFRVLLVDEGRARLVSRVVVGKPFTQTPSFRADMTYVTLNPSWTIPPSIVKKDVIPGIRKDPNYLERKGYTKIGGQYVQPPGPKNALGQAKLMFPNPHYVYLHDTPNRELFATDTRTFSHGCIRVDKVVDLAALAIDDPVRWSRARIDSAIATGRTRNITLPRRLPVLLIYWTAVIDPDDRRPRFFTDVYRRDPAYLAALDRPFRFRPVPPGTRSSAIR